MASLDGAPAAPAPAVPAPAAPPVVDADPGMFVFGCPHCGCYVQVPRDGLACQVFRHGAYRSDARVQINPHATRKECESLAAAGLIYGCGGAFMFDGVLARTSDEL